MLGLRFGNWTLWLDRGYYLIGCLFSLFLASFTSPSATASRLIYLEFEEREGFEADRKQLQSNALRLHHPRFIAGVRFLVRHVCLRAYAIEILDLVL